MDPELQQLKDIHLPPAISTWPIAPAWVILLIALLGLIIYLIYFFYKRKKRKMTGKFALTRLQQLKKLNKENTENINIAAEISTLIRRTALYYYKREEIAGLSGNEWLKFLNASGDTMAFTQEAGQLLINTPYCKNQKIDLIPLFDLTQKWLVVISKNKRASFHV